MNATPTQIQRTSDSGIEITWSDGDVRTYTGHALREACPCATCREKRSAASSEPDPLAILSEQELAPASIVGMKPVGSYAYNIEFSDGHDTGIFTLAFLKEIGSPVSD